MHSLIKYIWKGERYDEVQAYTFETFVALMQESDFRLENWACWPSYFSIHYGHVLLPDGRNLGELLDLLALHFDRANGTQSFSCYGYAFAFVAE